jgi:hypothetical protein
MSGQNVLQDFRKFFSRNQIIKVLEVLSSGQSITANAKAELEYLDSTNYIINSGKEKYKISIPYRPIADGNYDSKQVIECMQVFSEINNGVYELIRNLPVKCLAVNSENIALECLAG